MSSRDRTRPLSWNELEALCAGAVTAAGGSPELAAVLATATVEAEQRGKPDVGAAHLRDYLDALRHGRLSASASPTVRRPRAATVVVDADRGAAQSAFALGFDALVAATRECGIGILTVTDGYSAGELAYYVRRVTAAGLIGLCGTNSPALMSVYGSTKPVAGTNPLAFGMPHPSGPRIFDQASSATAWVRVRDAAARGDALPEGWALDADGHATTDAAAGLAGALLPFGGAKGANIAMMVELLATLAGASFSIDAAPFDSGEQSPRLGLFVVAIDPTAFGDGAVDRAEQHLERLAADHGADFGRRTPSRAHVELPADLYRELVQGWGENR